MMRKAEEDQATHKEALEIVKRQGRLRAAIDGFCEGSWDNAKQDSKDLWKYVWGVANVKVFHKLNTALDKMHIHNVGSLRDTLDMSDEAICWLVFYVKSKEMIGLVRSANRKESRLEELVMQQNEYKARKEDVPEEIVKEIRELKEKNKRGRKRKRKRNESDDDDEEEDGDGVNAGAAQDSKELVQWEHKYVEFMQKIQNARMEESETFEWYEKAWEAVQSLQAYSVTGREEASSGHESVNGSREVAEENTPTGYKKSVLITSWKYTPSSGLMDDNLIVSGQSFIHSSQGGTTFPANQTQL
jgi:hypothetical protein